MCKSVRFLFVFFLDANKAYATTRFRMRMKIIRQWKDPSVKSLQQLGAIHSLSVKFRLCSFYMTISDAITIDFYLDRITLERSILLHSP